MFDEYFGKYLMYHHRLSVKDPSVLAGLNTFGLYESVKASMNTRRLGMTYEDHLALFGPEGVRDPADSPFMEVVEHMAGIAFREVVATRKACGEVNVLNRLWPNALRVTCHKGAKNGIWHVGLRTYPEYYRSAKLLPYHGVPLVLRGKDQKLRLEIHPEIILRSRADFVRVMKPGDRDVYYYDASHLPQDYSFDFLRK